MLRITSASNYGVVALVTPPTLKLVDQQALIKFETEYAAYKNRVDDGNKDLTEKIHASTIKDCMDPATLHALYVMGEISKAEKVEDAKSEAVQRWFETASSLAPKDLSQCIDSAIQSVVYEENKEDPAGGVTNFIVKVITVLDQNNASEDLKDQDLARTFIDRLIKKLRDPVLQERTKVRRRGWTKAQLSDIKFFKNETTGLAVDLALTETARERVKPRNARHGHTSRSRKNDHGKSDSIGAKAKNDRRGSKRKVSEWTDPCHNLDCGGKHPLKHPLKDCPNTSDDRKKELFDEHDKNKKAKKFKIVS